MAQWIEGTIVDNVRWSENLFSLKIDADIDTFVAGQFTSLALDINGERIARPYSYLSSPDQRPVEFYFYTATDGILSNAMLNLKPNDSIWIKQQANGFFTLDEVPDSKNLWLLGTGTGVAPFFSILNTEKSWQRFEHIVLIHAVRTTQDLLYQEIVKSLKQKYAERFRFQAVVSREHISESVYGRIPAAIESGELEKSVDLKLALDDSQIMLCGNPEMVKDTVDVLKARGFTKNRRRTPGHITVENYW
ncbi:MAG: ferredoxin--NADP(+) reductase [SAR86 cluster bacterium]|uniref:ferredoxin--NADP(+) reductase n=1 Tax=SAR86 cluster bacterium TaxID=2030880 RepID=A0A2A5AXV0_9GAMM|nr:MAG: ferredoxin--NADP(+) reductase [SAR86 cluster bacterium]